MAAKYLKKLGPGYLLLGVWVAAFLICLPLFIFHFIEREKLAFEHLETLAQHKKNELESWMTRIDVDLLRLAQLPNINAQYQQFDPLKPELLDESLESYLSPFGHFIEIFLLNSAGDVIYSTDSEQVGKNKASRPYFIQGIHAPFIQNTYHSVTLQSAAMTLARPLHIMDGDQVGRHKIGVIAARVNLDHLHQLMASVNQEKSQGARSYLINQYHFFITPPQADARNDYVYPRATHSQGAKKCLLDKPFQDIYLDHRLEKVKGIGHWLPNYQLCLLVEQDYTSRFYLLGQQLLWLVALLLPISLVTWLLSSRLLFFREAPEVDKQPLDSRFLSLLGHEIRTPLNGIIGMLSLLQESRLNPEQRQQAKVADASAQQLLNLLNHMISRARQGQDRVAQDFQWEQITQPLELLLRSFTPAAEQKGLKLELEKDFKLEQLEIKTHLTQLLQIVSNLLENAIKFTEQGSICLYITSVQLSSKRRLIRIQVKDTGPGIALEDQQRIFDPFERLEPLPNPPVTSLGLGLAICKELAEHLNGELQLVSTPGEGSLFSFEFIAYARKAMSSAHQNQ